jgi:hypothetical protein
MEIKVGQRWIRKPSDTYYKPLYITSTKPQESIQVRIDTTQKFTYISRAYLWKNYELDTVYESTRQFDQDLEELLNE